MSSANIGTLSDLSPCLSVSVVDDVALAFLNFRINTLVTRNLAALEAVVSAALFGIGFRYF